MLTKKQKQALWQAGNEDSLLNEILCEHADDYINSNDLGIKDKDKQLAIEAYCDGFHGDNEPK